MRHNEDTKAELKRFKSKKLCTTMKAKDVTDTLELGLEASGCDEAHMFHKPSLLSDNGSIYISGDLANWLGANGMDHTLGAPNHPQTQGKIEHRACSTPKA